MRVKPWEVPDGLWQRIEPLLPKKQRRFRYPGRKPLDDRKVLQGIVFVLHTGIGWEHLPQELLSRQCRDRPYVERVLPGQHRTAERGLAQRIAGALAVGDVQ